MKRFNSQLCYFLFMCFTCAITIGVFAQDEMDDEDSADTETVECAPSSFETSYEKYKLKSKPEVDSLGIWYSLGSEAYKQNNFKSTIPYYWKVLINDTTGKFKITYSKLARCYYEMARSTDGSTKSYLDSTFLVTYRGLEKYPNSKPLHDWAGRTHNNLNHGKCAIPHFEKLVEMDPKNKGYVKILARLYFDADDERAIAVQQRYIDLAPEDAQAANLKIEMLKAFGIDPIVEMKKSYEKDPTNVKNAMRYGSEALVVGDLENAQRAFSSVLEQEPKNVQALKSIAKTQEGLNQRQDAIDSYKKVLQLNAKDIEAMLDLANVYTQNNQFSTARRYVVQAKKIDPKNGRSYIVMGDIYVAAAEYCSSNRGGDTGYKYDDKLVFEKARSEYLRAASASVNDPVYGPRGENLASGLRDFVRTKEDIFMQNKRQKIKDKCYNWLK